MKFYIRRAIAGAIAIPFIAGAYCFGYMTLILVGVDEVGSSLIDTYNTGLTVATALATIFTFAPQFNKFVNLLQ